MNKNAWLNSLETNDFGQIKKCLELLKNPEKMYKIVGLNGKNNLDVTKEFLLSGLSKYHVGVVDYDTIKYDNLELTEEDIEFHSNCIKRIVEENGLNVSFSEAILLIAFNIFREKKMEVVIVKKDFEATKQIDCFINICHEYDETIPNAIYISDENQKNTINKKDIFIYKCEMCSFNYSNIDFDINMIGSYNAYYACLAIWVIQYLFPSTKTKKLKKPIDEVICAGKMERVNVYPRVILNIIENEFDILNVNSIIDTTYNHKKVFCLMEEDYAINCEKIVCSIDEITKYIREAKDNDVLFIIGSMTYIKNIRLLFRK